jgi:hypothetical protein
VKPLARVAGARRRVARVIEALGGSTAELPARAEDRVRLLRDKVEPLRLNVSAPAPRLNLLLPTIDLSYVFGGYIAKLNLARRLADRGFRVRIVLVDWCDFRPAEWSRRLASFEGLAGLFDRVEIASAADRRKALPVSRDDAFVATTWWTAHLAHAAARELGRERFVYLIQEYEPFTFAMGAFAAAAAQSYGFPHDAVFSTELLRRWFRERRLGVYEKGEEAGDRRSVSFENAITAVGPVAAGELANRSPRRLLFYARPEGHAARNMFELGILALERAVERGAFLGAWELDGIGTVGRGGRVDLGAGASLRLLPRLSQDAYREVLRAHDVGLSLMYTPHPSLVPLEMASAGMLVVTNTFENKTAERLRAISPNLLPVEPTLDAVTAGLVHAAAAVEDVERRAAGSAVAWSTDWDDSFGGGVLDRIAAFVEDAGGAAAAPPRAGREPEAAAAARSGAVPAARAD